MGTNGESHGEFHSVICFRHEAEERAEKVERAEDGRKVREGRRETGKRRHEENQMKAKEEARERKKMRIEMEKKMYEEGFTDWKEWRGENGGGEPAPGLGANYWRNKKKNTIKVICIKCAKKICECKK